MLNSAEQGWQKILVTGNYGWRKSGRVLAGTADFVVTAGTYFFKSGVTVIPGSKTVAPLEVPPWFGDKKKKKVKIRLGSH